MSRASASRRTVRARSVGAVVSAGLFIASLALLAALTALAPRAAAAQTIRLTLNGWPLTAPATDGAAFEAGFVLIGTTSFTVDVTVPGLRRATTVQVECRGGCPQNGGGNLPLTGLQWRRADQSGWTTLTEDYVDIETRNVNFLLENDPWSQTMYWRYLLDWTANPPSPNSTFRIRFRLLVTAP